ncbi:hypothetical protein ACFL0Y_03315 [Patescibacteria group bacterium]
MLITVVEKPFLFPLKFVLISLTVFLISNLLLTTQVSAQSPLPDRPYLIGWFSTTDQEDPLASLAEMASSGTKIVIPFGIGAFSTEEETAAYLDEAQRLGVQVIVDLHVHPDLGGNFPSIEELAAKVAIHRDHPAVFGWLIADEPSVFPAETPAYTLEFYNRVKDYDPTHPVMIIHWYGADFDPYVDSTDFLILNFYPTYTRDDPTEFNSWVRQSYSHWLIGNQWVENNNREGLITAVQGFGPELYNSREMTMAEYRFHVLSSLVLETDAIVFYLETYPDSFLKSKINDLISLTQVIGFQMKNGLTYDPSITVSELPDQLVYRHGTDSLGQHVILTVNIAEHDAENNDGSQLSNVLFSLPSEAQPPYVEVLTENRIIRVYDNTFLDNFDKFAVHAYSFNEDPLAVPIPYFGDGDVDQSSSVDAEDFRLVLAAWGKYNLDDPENQNHDYQTNFIDGAVVLANWSGN